jgi:lipid-A-disaccharide synthase
MAKIVDHMAVIFPFEVALYDKANVPVTFTGHPLVDEIAPDKTTAQARQVLGLHDRTCIGLFPGSRRVEIERLLPIQIESARLLRQHYPDCQFVLPLASTIKRDSLSAMQSALDELDVVIIENNTHDVIQACDVIIVASGTATLEIGLYGKPMVIMHRVAALSYYILRALVKLKHIGLVNIVPGKEVVKEFIQNDATAANIVTEVRHILDDERYNQTMRDELGKLRELLGEGGGSKKVAQLAMHMLEENR